MGLNVDLEVSDMNPKSYNFEQLLAAVFLIVHIIIALPIIFYSIFVYIRNRHKQKFAKRHSIVLLLLLFALVFYVLVVNSSSLVMTLISTDARHKRIAINSFTYYFDILRCGCWLGGALLCLWRCWILYFDFYYSQAVISVAWKSQLNPHFSINDNWFLKHKRRLLGSPFKCLLLVCIFWAILFCLIGWLLARYSFFLVIYSIDTILFILLIVASIISCAISPVMDAFHIRDELVLQIKWSFVYITLIIINSVLMSIHSIFTHHATNETRAALLFMINDEFVTWGAITIMFIATVWVNDVCARDSSGADKSGGISFFHSGDIFHSDSTRDKPVPLWGDMQSMLTLKDVLEDRDGFCLFMQHLSTEFSGENLLFIVEWLQLHNSLSKYIKSVKEEDDDIDDADDTQRKTRDMSNPLQLSGVNTLTFMSNSTVPNIPKPAHLCNTLDDLDIGISNHSHSHTHTHHTAGAVSNSTALPISVIPISSAPSFSSSDIKKQGSTLVHSSITPSTVPLPPPPLRSRSMSAKTIPLFLSLTLPRDLPRSHLLSIQEPFARIQLFFEKYIPSSAPLELNISYRLRKRVVKQYQLFLEEKKRIEQMTRGQHSFKANRGTNIIEGSVSSSVEVDMERIKGSPNTTVLTHNALARVITGDRPSTSHRDATSIQRTENSTESDSDHTAADAISSDDNDDETAILTRSGGAHEIASMTQPSYRTHRTTQSGTPYIIATNSVSQIQHNIDPPTPKTPNSRIAAVKAVILGSTPLRQRRLVDQSSDVSSALSSGKGLTVAEKLALSTELLQRLLLLFDEVAQEAYQLMKDAFRRFRNSDEYAKLADYQARKISRLTLNPMWSALWGSAQSAAPSQTGAAAVGVRKRSDSARLSTGFYTQMSADTP